MAKIDFVLPVKGGGGGAHSVVQEVTSMRRLGAEARILVNERNFAAFRRNYNRFDWLEAGCFPFEGPKGLAEHIADSDVVVATTNTSAHSIAEAAKIGKSAFRPAYYVQDYEPLFYTVGSEAWNVAVSSFSLFSSCTYFSKTRWLQDIVNFAHDHDVAKVTPSIDHEIYYPGRRKRLDGRRTLCAMVRPPTPRRAPNRTMRTLGRLIAEFGQYLDVIAFGTTNAELASYGISSYDGVEVVGILSQSSVADLLRQSDYFVDLSDYQAFGRTAAEAMACGTIALAPTLGGSQEFIIHGRNSFLVDTSDEGAVYSCLSRMISMSESEMRQMQMAALEAVCGFTPVAAAISEFRALDMA